LIKGKKPLGRPRRRWVDVIKMDLKEIGRDGRDWIELAQDRDQWRALMNTVMNLGKPEGKRPLGRPRRRWVANIKMDLKRDRVGWCGLDETGSGWGPVEGSCEYGDEPSGSLKLLGIF
jgi:hypothetical protein